MSRPSHQPFTFELRTLLIRGRVGREQRRQLWEVVKVIGTICLIFGVIASLLAYFATNESLFHEERLALETIVQQHVAGEDNDRDEILPREVYVGEYSSMRGAAKGSASLSDGNGIRVVDFEISAMIKGTVDESYAVERKLRGYEQRVREAMSEVARKASEEDLADPDTRTIRTQICQKLNSFVGGDLFDRVMFSRFRVYEN